MYNRNAKKNKTKQKNPFFFSVVNMNDSVGEDGG